MCIEWFKRSQFRQYGVGKAKLQFSEHRPKSSHSTAFPSPFTEQRFPALFKESDIDGDGGLDRNEFYRCLHRVLVRRPSARFVPISAVGARLVTALLRQVNEYEVQVTKMQNDFDRQWRCAGSTSCLFLSLSRSHEPHCSRCRWRSESGSFLSRVS
jgi:hypothetical protein